MAKAIKFTTDEIPHLASGESYKKGTVIKSKDWRTKSWIKSGVAEEVDEKELKTANSEDKNGAPKTESKSKK